MTTRSQSQPTPAKKLRFGLGALSGIVGELRKVVWPSRRETLRLTLVVIVVCVIVGAILGVLDFGFTNLFQFLIGR